MPRMTILWRGYETEEVDEEETGSYWILDASTGPNPPGTGGGGTGGGGTGGGGGSGGTGGTGQLATGAQAIWI